VSESLGAILGAARISKGWSLRKAERATGIPNAHISQIETGTIVAPGIAVLVKLAKAYGLPMRQLTEAAGHGEDWDMVAEVSEAEIRADEREKIAQLADENGATYQTCPCDPARGIGDPSHTGGSPAPFADLIREQP
jgi:transcriptional regulator with XRE-family HTH domain